MLLHKDSYYYHDSVLERQQQQIWPEAGSVALYKKIKWSKEKGDFTF